MRESTSRTGGIFTVVLGAGLARRMGRQKLLLPMPDGRPILRATIDAACGTSAAGVLLVIGEDGEKLAEAVAGAPVTVLRNPRASEGQSTSLHVAVAALIHLRASAGVFMLADQPEISPESLQAVMQSYEESRAPIVQAQYRDGFGHPVLFSSDLYDALLTVVGDAGGRRVIRDHQHLRHAVAVGGLTPPDIDTPDDYAALLARWAERGASFLEGKDASGR
ncbi:nucleotidyltransferase family protein [Alicyclobacillus fastidiosus]|uniref:Nucleotidyltransferase family protein n=1 Tax=Alicyclobacillus fastidiosus TaxID=392011 RepID=A0ABY6ZNT7_9BACL|nr:nucleotidyltransferase family protein [Alicyclobacillus fastidiosus]WAH44507.1 nucleotidyltransferase family protein [Alicyclobacillus fastidiosus]